MRVDVDLKVRRVTVVDVKVTDGRRLCIETLQSEEIRVDAESNVGEGKVSDCRSSDRFPVKSALSESEREKTYCLLIREDRR